MTDVDRTYVPDCPKAERVDVELTGGRWGQVLNARHIEQKSSEDGAKIPPKIVKRRMGDRFEIDRRQLGRMLRITGGVQLVEVVDEQAKADAEAERLDAEREKLDAEQKAKQAEIAAKAQAEAENAALAV